MTNNQIIEDIRNKADIVAVISEFVPLKKRGRNYLGLCPFHSEKTASFTVSPEKQLFHCFGCGEGGNVFTFLMKMENIGFGEALVELGNKVGITVEKLTRTSTATSSEKNKIYEANELAANFFVQQLKSADGVAAMDYIDKRKISVDTAKTFALGYAPAAWDSLFNYLIRRGVAPKAIEQAGLILPREGQDGYYDRFRNRLMFPVNDSRGRVIAFSGRALDNSEPKYLNSPDTPIYRKGDSIFGLSTTKDEIKKEKFAVLVEGNIDLLSAYQAGVKNVTAPLGTALTLNQCKLLARATDTVVVAFDADLAGDVATEKAAEVLRGQNFRIKVAELAGAKDPDELIQKEGANAFQKAVQNALPFLEYKLKRLFARHNLQEIEDRARALREVAKLLNCEGDPFAQKEYAKLVAGQLKTDVETILAEVKRQSFYRQESRDLRRVTEKPASKIAEAEKKLIALAARGTDWQAAVMNELTIEDFYGALAKKAAAAVFSGKVKIEEIADEDVKNYLTGALLAETADKPEEILKDCVKTIKDAAVKVGIEDLKVQLREAEKAGKLSETTELLAAINSALKK